MRENFLLLPILLSFACAEWVKITNNKHFQWHQGDGQAICGEKARHTTGICRRMFSNGKPIVECNTDVFFDGYGVPDARGSGRAERFRRRGVWCVGSREFPQHYQFSTGGRKPPTVGGLEPNRPRPHSEIAALSDLFDIRSGLQLDTWASTISRKVGVYTRYDVFLYQSHEPPCTTDDVGVRHGALHERMACSLFLGQLVEQVRQDERSFNIYVFTPKGPVTTYGTPLSRQEVAHFMGVGTVPHPGNEWSEGDITERHQGITYDELKRYILRELNKKEEKNLCSMLISMLEREYPNYYEYLDLPGFGAFGVDYPGVNDEGFVADDVLCDRSSRSHRRHRRWRRLRRCLLN